MSDKKNNQKTKMGNCLPVNRFAGHNSHQGGLELRQTHPDIMITPLIQYPADDTMPAKLWVFEKQPASNAGYKPLRPEDERKALEVINRHLPPSEKIKIPQQSLTGPGGTPHSGLALYSMTNFSLPIRCRDHPEKLEAVKPHSSPKTASLAKPLGKDTVGSVRSMKRVQTEDEEDENAWMEEGEDDLPVFIVPEIMVTNPDGETRRLRDTDVYVSGR